MRRLSVISGAILGWTIALAGVSYLQAASQDRPSPVSPSARSIPPPGSPYQAVLTRYCISCHNEKLKTGGLTLDRMDVENVPRDAETWEKVIRKLRAGAMPPAGLPRPDHLTYDSFATYLEKTLDRAAEATPNPGSLVIHRLNRAEYTNAIRDLLAIDIDGRSLLPSDDFGEGFDNIAANLSVSPVLLERYMSAAEKIIGLAIGDTAIRPDLVTYRVPKFLWQTERMNEALPFGSRGGTTIRHYFPLDAEYVIEIRLQRSADDTILGIETPKQLDVRVDGARIKLFTIGGEVEGPEKASHERTADAALKVRFPVKAGSRLVQVTFLKDSWKPEGVFRQRLDRSVPTFRGDVPEGVATVSVDGPYAATGPGDTPSRRKIFACRPTSSSDEAACARKVLSTLVRRAYRRPATDGDIVPLLGLYRAGRSKGGFEAGIGLALQGMLVSPGFLFRVERNPARVASNTAYRIGDLDLASRLSFFLWSSIPDDDLLELAERGKLRDPMVVEQQVRRMLADTRSTALVSNFTGQWLYLRNLETKTPDPLVYPEFDENLREALQRETQLFFESIVREDRSVLDLLDADYTFVNARLAAHYGIPNIHGTEFRRVKLTDENRKGLLGHGSILAVTSYATRTAPTLRGKWLLENVLGAPPPPPPGDVPSLKDDERAQALTMRERMEEHRKNPVCASCHAQMDPLGFALENVDAVGKWRTTSGAASTPNDASGVLPDGTKFQGPAELTKILLDRRDQFVATFVEKLFTYALGRRVEYYDAPAVRKIARDTAPEHRWSSVVLAIVKSTPFQFTKPGSTSAEVSRR